MKCQLFFPGENEKTIANWPSAEFAQGLQMVKKVIN